MARINLRKFLNEHYKGGVTARDVIREAVTNSIHASATSISVDLQFDRHPTLFGDDARSALHSIRISDNGEGFTDDNLNYFDEVYTNHKDHLGGKGVGRLSFLKFADSVKIESQLPSKKVQFFYTPDFKLDDVEKIERTGPNSTVITISKIKDRVNSQVTKLVNSICDDLRLLLFLKKQAGKSVEIEFTHNSQQPFPEHVIFGGQSIEAYATHAFEFEGERFDCYLFRDEPPLKGITAMLCADEICVEEMPISKRFDICRYVISVTSGYLSGRANMERKRLEIPATSADSDLISPISRESLMPRIRAECLSIINAAAQNEIQEFKQTNVKKLVTYYPFIQIDSLNGEVGLLDADEIVKTYRAQLARREDTLVEAMEVGAPIAFDDISHLASDDLARFIVHRALVIESLAKMPRDAAEEALHNAILKKHSDGNDIRENNVWLIDDKFLSYNNIFSDEALAKVVKEVNEQTESKQQRRPDIAGFFSKDNSGHPNKLVIVEFKKPGADIFENNKALLQCRFYANELVKRVPTLREVFAFAVVEIDDEFYADMKQTNFKDVFSLNEKVLYNDFQIGSENDVPLHFYVMPASSFLIDAKARNRVFEEVLQFNAKQKLR
ncbi:ATP-binding protein [Roseococcus microcysteis]|uniref:ATP-binding protein n=1 Tax=Roseococcus microcysteis TaxID=2771361 RepID=UPI00168AB744|nr:ATP-binding protein [Roseococcus microcysteis]